MPVYIHMHAHSVFFVHVTCVHIFFALWHLVVLLAVSVFLWVGLSVVSGFGGLMNNAPCECISVISQQWHVYCSSLLLVPPHGFLCDMVVSVCQVPTCVTILVAPNVTYQPLVISTF